MKQLFSIMTLLLVFSGAQASDLKQLPDIAPNIEDRQSDQEIQKIEEQLQIDFENMIVPSEVEIQSMEFNRAYSHIDPYDVVPQDLLNEALSFFDSNKHRFSNRRYISVVDFSKRSNLTRFFVINMSSGTVYAIRTAHGSGGDVDNDGYVESVSNVPNSHKSSIGYYKVSETYYGKYGRSIRLDGLSNTNSKVRSRAIVIHGSDYVKEADMIQGRSWGCFALSWSVKDDIVDRINGGSLLYTNYSH